jgi:asparagine synthase (glutamine-hydrolysing)
VASTILDTVTTFSSCAEDPRFDEREYIEPVVEKTGAIAHYLFPDPGRLLDPLPKMIAHQDEPWTSMTMLAHWMLMERARSSGVTVLLNGHGGDETTAGYYPHLTSFQTDLLKQLRLVAFVREFGACRNVHGVSVASSLGRVGRLLASRPLGAVRDGLGLRRRHFPRLDPDVAKRHETVARPSRSRSSSYLTNELMAGAEVSPIPAWLRYEDRNSMAFSVETRQPFLDHRLVEFLLSIPANLKIRSGVNKFILRRALQAELPEAVRTRVPKLGFTTGAQSWFREELHDLVWEMLTSKTFESRGVFDVEQIKLDFKEHCAGRVNKTAAIWSCVNLELWFRHFFD